MQKFILFLLIGLSPIILSGQRLLGKTGALQWDSAGVSVERQYEIELSRRGKDKDTLLVRHMELLHISEDSMCYLVHEPRRMGDTTMYKTTWNDSGLLESWLHIEQSYFRNIDLERSKTFKPVWKDDWTFGGSNVTGYRYSFDSLGRKTLTESFYGTAWLPMYEVNWSCVDSIEDIRVSRSRYLYGPDGLDSIQDQSFLANHWSLSTSYTYDESGNLLRQVRYISGEEDHTTSYSYDSLGRVTSRIDSMLLLPEDIYQDYSWSGNYDYRRIELHYRNGDMITVMSNSKLLAKETRTWFTDDSVEVVIDLHSEEWYDPSDTADVHYIEFSNAENERNIKWINYYGEPQGPEPYDPRRTHYDWIPSPGAIRTGEFSKGDRRRFIWVYE